MGTDNSAEKGVAMKPVTARSASESRKKETGLRPPLPPPLRRRRKKPSVCRRQGTTRRYAPHTGHLLSACISLLSASLFLFFFFPHCLSHSRYLTLSLAVCMLRGCGSCCGCFDKETLWWQLNRFEWGGGAVCRRQRRRAETYVCYPYVVIAKLFRSSSGVTMTFLYAEADLRDVSVSRERVPNKGKDAGRTRYVNFHSEHVFLSFDERTFIFQAPQGKGCLSVSKR